jgi:maltooligosyltrehalose trehalohydrolase
LKLVSDLLALRQQHIIPRLRGARFGAAEAADNGLLTAHWKLGDGATLRLLANLSDNTIAEQPPLAGTNLWGRDARNELAPWSVFWRMEN